MWHKGKRGSRGQSSLEYMVMLAIALGVFAAILVATSQIISSSSSQIGVESGERAAAEIKEAADFVYVHGHPSKVRVRVYIPPSVREVGIEPENNRTVYVRLDSTPYYTDIYEVVRGNVTGNLSLIRKEGYYTINVESIDYIWSNITVVTGE
jgi:uncharacterized protein (UPF0333 family)